MTYAECLAHERASDVKHEYIDGQIVAMAGGTPDHALLAVNVGGDLRAHEEDPDAATNPTLLVEVLSETTEKYDRGEKFAHYRRLVSLSDYVLVSQDTVRVEHFRRNDDGSWTYRSHGPGETVTLDSIDCTLPVDEVYDQAELLGGTTPSPG